MVLTLLLILKLWCSASYAAVLIHLGRIGASRFTVDSFLYFSPNNMKRGFILRAEQKKAAAKRRSAQQQIQHLASSSPTTAVPGRVASQQLKGEGISQVDQENRSHIGFQISGLGVDENQKLAYGNLSEADKGHYFANITHLNHFSSM